MAVPGAVLDPNAVVGETVTFNCDGATVDAYLARPRSGNSNGAIIVIHEAFGPVEHIFDLARRFANLGYDAIAPNLYCRVGAPNPTEMSSVMEKMFGVADNQVVRDLEATADYVRALPGATGKVGCIGFCSGGRQTLLFACSSTKVDAAVDCWGGMIDKAGGMDGTPTPQRPRAIIDMLSGVACPVYLVGGEEDQMPPPAVLTEAKARLDAAGKNARLDVFAGAGHAFLADYRDSYREGPAHELWPKIVEFFAKNLR